MSSVVISGDSSGTVTLTVPSAAGTNTVTIPASTGTVALLQTPSFTSTIGVGGATPASSGAGITFPATQSASTDANTLDDYEEGTWTPVLTFGGGSTGITYGSRSASYTKIGDTVYVAMDFALTNKGSSTGSVWITGLPFTTSGTVSNVAVMSCLLGNASSLPSTLVAGALNTNLYVYYTYSSGYSNLTNSTANNNSSFTICGSYKAA